MAVPEFGPLPFFESVHSLHCPVVYRLLLHYIRARKVITLLGSTASMYNSKSSSMGVSLKDEGSDRRRRAREEVTRRRIGSLITITRYYNIL